MKRAFAWGLLAASTAIALFLYARQLANPPADLPVIAVLPHFELVERDGSTVGLRDLAGGPWIADFVFTRCTMVCPLLTGKMKELRSRLPAGSRARSVSISVDPEYDTPEVLTRYAQGQGIVGSHWLFLTGEVVRVRGLIREGFLLPVEETPENTAMPVLHSSRFALVDGAGQVRGLYEVLEAADFERLLGDLAALEREAGRRR